MAVRGLYDKPGMPWMLSLGQFLNVSMFCTWPDPWSAAFHMLPPLWKHIY